MAPNTGDRPIATLVPGDLVYSIDHGATVVPQSSTGTYFMAGEPVASTMTAR